MDTTIRVSRFEDGSAAPAFPLGGRTGVIQVAHAALTPLGDAVSDAGSLFMLHVPEGSTVRYGIGPQVDALPVSGARAIMYPLSAGDWMFQVSNAVQPNVRLIADGAADVACSIMEAASV